MLPVMRLEFSNLFLMKDQRYRGRCVISFHEHRTELFHLDSEELAGFMRDVSRAADAVNRLFAADKINYAIYGDLVPHLHVHIVPKQRNKEGWGEPFVTVNPSPRLLPNTEYARMINDLKSALSIRAV